MEIKVFDSAVEVSKFVAEQVLISLKAKPDLVMGLATGRTMDAIYHQLVQKAVKGDISFESVRAFAVDEYLGLPEDSENSYKFYLNLHLYDQLNFKKDNLLNKYRTIEK